MGQSNIPAGSPLAKKVFGAALFARTIQAPSMLTNITGKAPKQSDAEAKLKGQTAADMPVVRVTDLSKSAGETISIDCFDTINGKPLMGDVNAEGKGEKLSSSSMDISIDLSTKVVDAGGKMTQQRTLHNLRGIAMAQLGGYFPRLHNQTALVHMAGARGSMTGKDWVVPLASDSDFGDVVVNSIKAPTYNRHYVVDGTGLTQGGAQLGSIDSTDIWTLDHIDELSLLLDDMESPLQNVRVSDDPMADDDPIKGILYLSPRQWNQIKVNAGGTSNNWRTFLQNAWNRKSYGTKHPLFSGEPGMWNGVLVRQMPRYSIRFAAGEETQIITEANRYTATESAQAVNSLTAGYGVERAVLLGAQAVAHVFGRNQSSEYHFSWHERKYNFDRNLEVGGDCMGGMSKVRFDFKDGDGNVEPTDNGVIVIDSAIKQ